MYVPSASDRSRCDMARVLSLRHDTFRASSRRPRVINAALSNSEHNCAIGPQRMTKVDLRKLLHQVETATSGEAGGGTALRNGALTFPLRESHTRTICTCPN